MADVLNQCLYEGVFPPSWKKARLVHLQKSEKSEGIFSLYRSFCKLNDVGKILKRLLVTRIEYHLAGAGGLSEGQFRFRFSG